MARRSTTKTSRKQKLLLAIASLGIAMVLCEAVLRVVSGHRLLSLRLDRSAAQSGDPAEALDTAPDLVAPFVVRLQERYPEIDAAWLRQSPAPLPIPPALGKALRPHDEWVLHYYLVNSVLLRLLASADPFDDAGLPEIITAFEPPDGNMRPSYRYPPSCLLPSGLITNAFGFRGRELPVDKPPQTVRIGFVGASTTVEAHGYGFRHSAPELIEHWLSLWAQSKQLEVQFETLNAGREGIQSSDIRAIVTTELMPLEVDYVVYYEGANNFRREGIARHVELEGNYKLTKPPPGLVEAFDGTDNADTTLLDKFSTWSATARYLRSALRRNSVLHEPKKPGQKLTLPPELLADEFPLDRAAEALDFAEVKSNLDAIRAALAETDSRIVVGTFWWLTRDGMTLDAVTSNNTHVNLNRTFWPYRYGVIRQLTDMQNNFFRAWAKANAVDLLEIGDELPRDERLSIDCVHNNELGIRLKAWLMFVQLVPILERDLAAGRIPVPDRHADEFHPNVGPGIKVKREDLRPR